MPSFVGGSSSEICPRLILKVSVACSSIYLETIACSTTGGASIHLQSFFFPRSDFASLHLTPRLSTHLQSPTLWIAFSASLHTLDQPSPTIYHEQRLHSNAHLRLLHSDEIDRSAGVFLVGQPSHHARIFSTQLDDTRRAILDHRRGARYDFR